MTRTRPAHPKRPWPDSRSGCEPLTWISSRRSAGSTTAASTSRSTSASAAKTLAGSSATRSRWARARPRSSRGPAPAWNWVSGSAFSAFSAITTTSSPATMPPWRLRATRCCPSRPSCSRCMTANWTRVCCVSCWPACPCAGPGPCGSRTTLPCSFPFPGFTPSMSSTALRPATPMRRRSSRGSARWSSATSALWLPATGCLPQPSIWLRSPTWWPANCWTSSAATASSCIATIFLWTPASPPWAPWPGIRPPFPSRARSSIPPAPRPTPTRP